MRITLQPSFVLHSRPYNESSALLDVFSQDYGLIKLIARGASSSRSRFRGVLRPFTPLLISWSGKTELMSMTAVEQRAPAYELQGRALLSGMYLNELLARLLLPADACMEVFVAYHKTLTNLLQPECLEKSLRLFEKKLLEELGYGLVLDREAVSGHAILPAGRYQYVWDYGLQSQHPEISHPLIFEGQQFLAFHQECLDNQLSLRCAKYLTRYAFNCLLGNKKLKSRDLFR